MSQAPAPVQGGPNKPKRTAPKRLTDDGRLIGGRLAGLTMWGAIVTLSWPIFAESLMNWLVGAVDTILAAGLSEAAADAIAGGAYLNWAISLVGMSIGVGTTAVVARSVGKGRVAAANAATGQSVLLALGAGVLTGLLIWLATPWFAKLLNLQGEGLENFLVYLRTLAWGVPGITLLATGIAACRGAGDSLRPLLVMVAVNVVNTLVSWALAGVDIVRGSVVEGEVFQRTLLHNPFGFDLGVLGIAWGTVVAWWLGAAAIAWLLIDGRSGVKLRRRRLVYDHVTTARVVRIAMPNFLEMAGMFAGNFLIVMMVGWMNSPGLLGAHIVTIRIEGVSFLPGFAMSIAAATLAGQYLGAGSPTLANRSVWACAGITAAFMGVMGLAFIFFPIFITGLFTPQETHLEWTPRLLFMVGFIQIPFGVGMVFRSALRGAGDAKVVMWLTWLTTWGIRLPLAYFLSGVSIPESVFGVEIVNPSPIQHGLVGLWYGLIIEIVLRCLAFMIRWFQGAWKTKKV
ncbi:MAG: MATE family efflux transporter [Phycisphaerales bacterium]